MIVPCRHRSSSPQRRRQWSDAPTGQDQASRALTIPVRHCCHVPRQQMIPIRLCGTVVRGSSGCVRGAGCCRSHNVYLSSIHGLDAPGLWSIGASRTVRRHVCPAIWDRSVSNICQILCWPILRLYCLLQNVLHILRMYCFLQNGTSTIVRRHVCIGLSW